MRIIPAAVAGGLTGVALSAICAALVAAFPTGFAKSYGASVFHGMDISALMASPNFTAASLITGFVYAFLTGAAIGGLFSAIYSLIDKKTGKKK